MQNVDRLLNARLTVTSTKRELFWRLLRSESPELTSRSTDFFIAGLTEAARLLQTERQRIASYRDEHEALRDIFKLIADPNGDVAKIRLKFSRLPERARVSVVRRAQERYPRLCGDDDITWARLNNWMQTSETKELLEKTQFLIATGRALSFGQERNEGRRSAPHIEPLILGQYRRLQHPDLEGLSRSPKPKGGRPRQDAVDEFLRRLGLLWLEVTGQSPRAEKGYRSPFVRMARIVLRCMGVKARDAALKRFWTAIRHHRNRTSKIPTYF